MKVADDIRETRSKFDEAVDKFEAKGWPVGALKVKDDPTTPVNTEIAGGSRYSLGKPKCTWAPYGGLEYIEEVSCSGAEKYAPLDYLNGQSFSTLLSCAFRHLRKALRDPLARDKESGHYHLAHAAWNILALLDFIAQDRVDELDDVSPWQGVTAAQRRALVVPEGKTEIAALRKWKATKE